MVVVARPDLIGAITGRLRSFSELTALVGGGSPRISGSRDDDWAMPTTAVVVRKAGGPRDELETAGRLSTRVDVICYGSTGYNADRVWAMVDAILVPAQGTRASWRRTVGGQVVRVDNVEREADAVSDVDPTTRWPFTFASYVFRWWG